jgi:outer membrane receptor protein involved in Fe transport
VLDYFSRDEILYGDRAFAATSNQAGRTGDPLANDFRSSAGIPGTIALRSNPGNRIPDTFGNDSCAAEDIVGTLCRYDYAPHMSLVPSSERVTANYMGRLELNPDHQLFLEFGVQNDKTIIKGAGSPSFNELFMDGDNINHPFANMPDHEFHGQDLTMRRRTVDIGNRKKENSANYFRSVIGMEGELATDWFYNAAMTYIKSESTERGVDGFPNSRRVQEAIDSGLWNPFEPSSNSQEALDYIETTTTRIGKSTSKSLSATVTGPVGELEAGEIMLALGTEYREDTISDNPDDQYLRGEVFGTEATQANGSRDNLAIFSELRLPMSDNFELQLAVRFEDYSDFGQTTDPKVAFIWNPMDNLSFRGSYGTAFRAPSLHQIGLGDTQESPSLVDDARCQAVGNVNKACDLQVHRYLKW